MPSSGSSQFSLEGAKPMRAPAGGAPVTSSESEVAPGEGSSPAAATSTRPFWAVALRWGMIV